MPRDLTNYTSSSVWEFMSEVEKSLDDFWRAPQVPIAAIRRETRAFTPAVDVRENDDLYLISVDIPEVSQSDVRKALSPRPDFTLRLINPQRGPNEWAFALFNRAKNRLHGPL